MVVIGTKPFAVTATMMAAENFRIRPWRQVCGGRTLAKRPKYLILLKPRQRLQVPVSRPGTHRISVEASENSGLSPWAKAGRGGVRSHRTDSGTCGQPAPVSANFPRLIRVPGDTIKQLHSIIPSIHATCLGCASWIDVDDGQSFAPVTEHVRVH